MMLEQHCIMGIVDHFGQELKFRFKLIDYILIKSVFFNFVCSSLFYHLTFVPACDKLMPVTDSEYLELLVDLESIEQVISHEFDFRNVREHWVRAPRNDNPITPQKMVHSRHLTFQHVETAPVLVVVNLAHYDSPYVDDGHKGVLPELTAWNIQVRDFTVFSRKFFIPRNSF